MTQTTESEGHSRKVLQQKLAHAVQPRFTELVNTLMDKAIAGDMSAMSLLMTRLIPPVRPASDPIVFNLAGSTMTDKATSILEAISTGRVAPDIGKTILDAVGNVVKIEDTEQVQRQLQLIQLTLDADAKAKTASDTGFKRRGKR